MKLDLREVFSKNEVEIHTTTVLGKRGFALKRQLKCVVTSVILSEGLVVVREGVSVV